MAHRIGRSLPSISHPFPHFWKSSVLHHRTSKPPFKFPVAYSHSDSSKNIIKCADHVDAVKGVTVPEFLWSNLQKWENAPAFECSACVRKYTHGMIYQKSRNFAAALKQNGLKQNDIVSILLPNVPEYPIAVLGIWEAGLIPTTINPSYMPAEVAKQIMDSRSKAIITLSLFLPIVNEITPVCPTVKSVIAFGNTPMEGCHSFDEMTNVNSQGVEFVKGSQIDTTNEIGYIPYSSGTTGPPKGVMLTHSNICTAIHQVTQPGFVSSKFFDGGENQERFLGILPFFHVYGFIMIMLNTLYQGSFMRTLSKFEPKAFAQSMRDHKPTVLHLAPPLIGFMVNCPDLTKDDFASVHTVVSGAAPAGEALINRLLNKAGKYIFLQEGLGMSETSSISHLITQNFKNTKIGSVGVPVPGTECKVIDADGNALGPNDPGELLIRGPQIMKGYFKNEKATLEMTDADGWLHTGDVVIYDEQQCFYIVDRMKELIKVKGLQVAPSELEDILRTHPNVEDVAVIGIPDERSGELPRAYVVRSCEALFKQGSESVTEKEIQDFIQQKVSAHKHLNGGVEFVDAIPKAASGKILRRELKAMYLASKNDKDE